jgi:hypothetical protein
MTTSTPDTPGTAEYDRFGPWIDQVRTPEDVPRLFRDHPMHLDGTRLVLKVPRNVARRDATPDMDLYDHLLVLDDRGLTVLSRRAGAGEAGYDARQVPFVEVAAVRDVVNLLDGRLTVLTRDGRDLTVAYNGSARDAVRGLVDGLRAGATAARPSPRGRSLLEAGHARADTRALDLGRDDLAVAGDVRDVTRHAPGLVPWAGHGRRRVTPLHGGVAQGLLHALSPATLQAGVLAGDEAALEVFGRHEWLLRGAKPVHSASRTVVPLGGLDAIEVGPPPGYAGVVVARLVAGSARVAVLVPEASAAHGLLAAAASGARR